MHALVQKGARLEVLPLMSLVAQLREVRALVDAHCLPRRLLTALLLPTKCSNASEGEASVRPLRNVRLTAPLRKHLENAYNEAQQKVQPLYSCVFLVLLVLQARSICLHR
jgi:hypothetical protein